MRLAGILVAAALAAACRAGPPSPAPDATEPAAAFVGSDRCATCHQGEYERWQASQHARAMQTPSRRTVLAPFAGERATHSGAAATFSSSDGRFVVRTEGPDGKPADFPVRYTFGVYPLQQYLLDLPGGRLQALGFAWDTREGPGRGQMWRHLYEGERIRPGDPLHWTGIHQNWNFMCADCHSTNVRKNYDAASKTFATTYSEISVGCEACHGPASRHVELASRQAVRAGMTGLAPALDERRGVSWGRDPSTGRPVRSTPRTADREIEVCARCHSRRTQLIDTVSAADSLHEGFRVSLLEPGLFHPDGQMREEVYNYASFLQSRMYASGVTCSDCHDPHTEAPRLPGDALCLTCHDGPTYDGPQHHLHPKASGAPGCVSCHMPAATYMLVDTRHDHSFRVPRPDRTSALGTPNACASCHADRDPAWAAEAIRKHRPSGSPGAQTFAEAFAAFDRGAPAGTQGVLDVAADSRQPAIVRASALWRLQHAGANVPSDLLERAARDESPLVRRVAAGFPFASTLGVLLGDRTLSVRLEAAGVLAQIPPADLPAALAGVRPRALEEYVAVQRFNADRPDGQLNIATGLTALGRSGEALAAMREAIRLDPTFVPAYVNLADVHRMQGDEAAAERVLRAALPHAGSTGTVHHALGLALVRQQRLADALPLLAEAARREPDNARFIIVHAVALHDAGRRAEALRVLKAFLSRRPDDRQARDLLETYSRAQ